MKQCPFCGSENEDHGMPMPIVCNGKWDTRPIEDRLQAELDTLQAQLRGIRPTDQLPEEDELVEIQMEDGMFYATFSNDLFWVDETGYPHPGEVILWRRRIPFTEEEK
jgi:hypothetical protein